MKTLKIVVHGVVQGVGFRMFILNEANKLGVKGYVKNNIDGTVEIIAQGTAEQFETLVLKANEGPVHSHVTSCDVEYIDVPQVYDKFSITG